MFYGELKAKIDAYVGLVSEPHTVGDRIELVYNSPTGVELFRVMISNFGTATKPNFRFGGTSSALPDSWNDLCRMHLGR